MMSVTRAGTGTGTEARKLAVVSLFRARSLGGQQPEPTASGSKEKSSEPAFALREPGTPTVDSGAGDSGGRKLVRRGTGRAWGAGGLTQASATLGTTLSV